MMQNNYIESVKKQFKYYKLLGDKTFEQLGEGDLFESFDKEVNSIAIIVNHMQGNMLSRWTDFLVADGEKEWRNRDLEFEPVITTRQELISKWNQGWNCLFKALDAINDSNFNRTIYIRNQQHTIVEAVNRQMMHYAYHIGQIVYIGTLIRGDSWISLSVPKGRSEEFNKQKFSKGKHDGHFTDDFK